MDNKSISTSENYLNPEEIKQVLNKISKGKDISKWDLGASSSKDISVQVYKGEAKQLKASHRSSITLRVWNEKGMIGITSTSDISEQGLRKALESAYESSKYANEKEKPNFSPLSKKELSKIDQPLKISWGIKRLYNELKDAEIQLLNKHKSIIDVPYNGFGEVNYERAYINSQGAERFQKNTQSSLYLYAKAQEDNRKPRSSGHVEIAYGSDDINIQNCIDEAAIKTINHLNYRPIKTGKYLICFKPEAFLDLLEAFSNIFNARSVLDGVSLSDRSSVGKNISSSLLNLNDNGLHKSNVGAITFDGEGTPTQDLSIIKNGILESFIHSELTAKEFEVLPTGHAGLGAKASVSPDWLIVSKSKEVDNRYSKLNHKKTMDEFVLIENLHALHAGVKASQGSFSLPFDGWLVKEGLKVSVESATVAGDIKDLLNRIINIEDEKFETHTGVSPHIWIDELSITGEK